jgi:hypothetical protein
LIDTSIAHELLRLGQEMLHGGIRHPRLSTTW